jgi:hydroxylamine reductase
VGVCSKTPEAAAMMDLLVDQTKRSAFYALRANLGDDEISTIGNKIGQHLFATMTNVNFATSRIQDMVAEQVELQQQLASRSSEQLPAGSKDGETVDLGTSGDAVRSMDEQKLVELGRTVGVDARRDAVPNEDIWSARELITYGVKGASAYADHAYTMGVNDPDVWRGLLTAMDTISPVGGNEQDVGALLGTALGVGGTNFRVMELLDGGHRQTFGEPEPTVVKWGPVRASKGAILVSGHDLVDTQAILEATKGTGVDVYTHGELLPAHGYPELKKYEHLVGHFGGAWQSQRSEFPFFPGAIVLTSNCLMSPRKSYRDRVYTRHVVGYDGLKHVDGHDFSAVVEHALKLGGFAEPRGEPETLTTGFGHTAVLSHAETIVGAIKDGTIKRFAVVGGCDGAAGERSYFHDFATGLPDDSVILTLGCGKYRFNDKQAEFGNIGNTAIPRMLDVGQCNDAFSAVKIALALTDALGAKSVNDLPISYQISHLEQKATAVFLTMLHLGIQGINLGPTLPAYVSKNILGVLVDKFGVAPVNSANPQQAIDEFVQATS